MEDVTDSMGKPSGRCEIPWGNLVEDVTDSMGKPSGRCDRFHGDV